MAKPSEDMRSMDFYHGTELKDDALSIWKTGLDPQYTDIKYSNRKPISRPVAGHVYITPKIDAIGGDFVGRNPPPNWMNRIGFVLGFDGKQLTDVQPDEDSVGLMVCWYWNRNSEFYRGFYQHDQNFKKAISSSVVGTLAQRAEGKLSQAVIKRAKDGETLWQIRVGKFLLRTMDDYEKNTILSLGAHVAHRGSLVPKSIWAIPVKKSIELDRDGSNFFEVAKLLKQRTP